MQPLHKIVTFSSAGEIRKATVFLDLDCCRFRVEYNDGEAWKNFASQGQAEESASHFVHCES